MLQLFNGCHCSKPTIFPANWDKAGASINIDWKVQFYFYDPLFKDKYSKGGKYCPIKGGVNRFKTLGKRREAIKILKAETMDLLTIEGYNFITGQRMAPDADILEPQEYEIDPSTGFSEALEAGLEKMAITTETKTDFKSSLKYTMIAIKELRFDKLEIQNIKRRHIKMIMEHLSKTKMNLLKTENNWSAAMHNRYRACLMSIFGYLIECEAVEYCPVDKIKKQKTIRKIRPTLTVEERIKVDQHLAAKFPSFNRFVHIFFHSGGRLTELMKLQAKHVDLKEQTYTSIIKKGRNTSEKKRTIKDIALPLWLELLATAKPDDYIFSVGLVPGSKAIRKEQVTRRWETHVKASVDKGGLNIKPDLYSLKHLNLDETVNQLDLEAAAAQAGHESTTMVRTVYAQGENKRQHEKLKKIGNSFAG